MIWGTLRLEITEKYGVPYRAEFRALLETMHPTASRFLEWGSGVTTSILCEVARTRTSPFVLSIDHTASYQRQVAAGVPKHPFLHLRTLDLEGSSYSQFDLSPSYSSYPLYLGLTFDVIFIDGRRRMECALTAAQCLNDNGIVILHHWRRSRYQGVLSIFNVEREGTEFLVLRPKKAVLRSNARQSDQHQLAVVAAARGPRAERELRITRPSFERYAKSIGADFVVVGSASTLPAHRLKACALEVAGKYDRMILADCDILVREQTPSLFSIVPETHVGVMFEGEIFPREGTCAELNALYPLEQPLQPRSYFNAGVMVLSRPHYRLLQALKDEIIFGHPQFEQGFLNYCQELLGIPAFPLTSDLNYIPDAEFLSTDWRFGFLVHYAGSGKARYNYSQIWQDVSGDRKTFTCRKGLSADVRDTLLKQAAREMAGETIYMSDPTDFYYVPHQAFLYNSAQGQTIGYIPAREELLGQTLAVYGPYIQLPAGSYTARFITPGETTLICLDAGYDVCLDGERIIASGIWPSDGRIQFELAEELPPLEIRIYRGHSELEFTRLEIEPTTVN